MSEFKKSIEKYLGIYKDEDQEKNKSSDPDPDSSSVLGIITTTLLSLLVLGIIFALLILPNLKRPKYSGQLAACESNLKNLATGLEMYSTDFAGYYPQSLNYLTLHKPGEGSYMKAIPNCPSCNKTYIYEVCSSPQNFTLCCGKEKAHLSSGTVKKTGNWPQYTPGQGIKLK